MSQQDAQTAGRSVSGPRNRLLPLLPAGLWVAALGTLAFVSANPVTLNRDQIFESRLVVSATVDDPASGVCTIVEVWKGPGETDKAITVRGLPGDHVQQGETYILPLLVGRGPVYEVTPATRVPGQPRLVYRASRAALAQLEQICDR
ncbi:MAG: hypothetical protein DWQ34_05210 [Planctomycetota bacterium]|nr:MAG: hypothetical protein DWQ29_23405 [Planctomycetota bacterium]REJ95880.1 MAG: hypothetical protein DWQ34_05210 [Planctomycetota bacterium]REK25235.1 MAG: hypothetical protein DWQ41_12555 [Planctomycetota bacterium]REK34672.1 MAG: hypothetical protein DWQ45_13005 [Planctomycetota bacterium]